jgi:hypothetical protein
MLSLPNTTGNEQRPQPQQRPPVALASSSRLNLEHHRNFLVGQALEVAHEQHFAVRLGQLVDRLADAAGQFTSGQLLAGCRAARQQLVGKLLGRAVGQPHVTLDRSPGGADVLPAQHQ